MRHLRDRVPCAALAREAGVSAVAVRELARAAAARLRHPEVAHLPTALRRALGAGGYTTRAAVDAAADAALLALPGITAAALWRLRSGLYDAPPEEAARRPYWRAYQQERRRPRPAPQARGDLPPHGALLADADGARLQCHACGRFYAGLARHARNRHGLGPDAYRERYGLARGQSLYAPAYAEKLRRTALARGQGAVGRARWAGVQGGAP